MSIEKRRRLAVAYQFELQAAKLGFSVVQKRGGYRYLVQDRKTGGQLAACVLPCTFDFYEYRLSKSKHVAGLLIVQEHNAIAPVPVLCLQSGRLYDPGVSALPERTNRKRRNQAEAKLLVSGLLIGDRGALASLQAMPLRTQQYYRARCQGYLHGRVGRPWVG
ncbi:MAG TPA: hypothetical protein VGD98_09815 [Ktedonobacteraceae bacterium]